MNTKTTFEEKFQITCYLRNCVVVKFGTHVNLTRARAFPWSEYWVVEVTFHTEDRIGEFLFKRPRNNLEKLKDDILYLCKGLRSRCVTLDYKVYPPDKWLDKLFSSETIHREILLSTAGVTAEHTQTKVTIYDSKPEDQSVRGRVIWTTSVPEELMYCDITRVMLDQVSDNYKFVFRRSCSRWQ